MSRDLAEQPVSSTEERIPVEEVDNIHFEVADGIGEITIDNPEKANSLDFEMTDAIVDAVKKSENNDDVKVIKLKSVGDIFCAGHDLTDVYKVYEAYDGEHAGERRPSLRSRYHFDAYLVGHYRDLLYSLKPIVTEIQGWCIGAGMGINAVSDITIASESAKLSHREQRLTFAGGGIFAPIEMLMYDPKLIREMMLTGETVEGRHAEALGLVNKTVPDDELADEVDRYCRAICNLPIDGIVHGSAITNQIYDILGYDKAFSSSKFAHTLATNIRFEEDEYNFVGEREKGGTSKAIEGLHERFEELGFN